jgi:uncharacterized membrane protein YhaH (DUF805 family)
MQPALNGFCQDHWVPCYTSFQPLAVESWAERNMLLLAGLLLLLIIAVLVSRRMRDANKT